MTGGKPTLVVTCDIGDARAAATELLADVAELIFIDAQTPQQERRRALVSADALLVGVLPREVPYPLWPHMGRCKFVQTAGTGIDFIDRSLLPRDLQFANNPGVSALPIAEQALGMAIALLRRLPQNHQRMREGHFDQWVPTRTLKGATCAILGYGGIGKEIARLVRALGATHVIAINTSGKGDASADLCGTLADLPRLLPQADVIFCCLPLTDITLGVIDATTLAATKPDAVLINVSRGEIIDQRALYERLRDYPDYSAGIDAWWVEPLRHGRFEIDHPFLDLPNLLASPHNSAVVPGSMDNACRAAAQNLRNYLTGAEVRGLARDIDWLTQNH